VIGYVSSKITFEELEYRSYETNDLYSLTYYTNNKLWVNKKGKRPFYRACPLWLLRLGSNQGPSDMKPLLAIIFNVKADELYSCDQSINKLSIMAPHTISEVSLMSRMPDLR
jgi:hypothetical protein